jgi:hypothetical protein
MRDMGLRPLDGAVHIKRRTREWTEPVCRRCARSHEKADHTAVQAGRALRGGVGVTAFPGVRLVHEHGTFVIAVSGMSILLSRDCCFVVDRVRPSIASAPH